MSELFDVLREDGTPAGFRKERDLIHRDGDWHGSVRLWLIRDGKALLQKRREDKESFPGCYDVACSGHIDAGEDAMTAAVREVQEELGLSVSPADLIFAARQKLRIHQNFLGREFVSNEINTLYLIRETVSLDDLHYQESEISGLKWMPLAELRDALVRREEAYCISPEEFEIVRKQCEKYGG